MSSTVRTVIVVAAAGFVGVAALLVTMRAQPSGSQAAASASAAGSATAAVVDGRPISLEELESSLAASIGPLERQIYEMKRARLDALIAERLLAAEAERRGTTVEALVAAEVTAKLAPVTDQEVDAFHDANKARLPAAPNIKEQIRAYLHGQRAQAARDAFVESLRSRAKVEVALTPPPVRRARVSTEGAPSRGPAAAPVTIVEFSDFHCPFCRRVQPTLGEILSRYPDRVRLVYRDLPLDGLHPQARRAAEAARCAHEQDRFWPYHDKLYAAGPDASDATLERLGREVGLDVAAFAACLASGRHRDTVQKDVEEAERLGLTGTPGFFINGRPLSGAQPLEAFVEIIEEELKTAGR